jgi:hypothetical protein
MQASEFDLPNAKYTSNVSFFVQFPLLFERLENSILRDTVWNENGVLQERKNIQNYGEKCVQYVKKGR